MQRFFEELVVFALFSAAVATPAFAEDVLTAARVPKAPELAAGTSDAAWVGATALVVPLAGGANFDGGRTAVTIKAVFTTDDLFLSLQYDDPSQSSRRVPYQKQSDGSWKKLRDPNDEGGDENIYYEDKFALIWNIDNSIAGFSQLGCMSSCHAGERGKPYGNKYNKNAGELGDIWHVKSVRTIPVGQIDDQYLDETRYEKETTPRAGRKDDPKTSGGYASVELLNGKPEFMDKNARPSNKEGGVYYLEMDNHVAFDDTKFKPGDEVPSVMVAPFRGDRGDIAGSMNWQEGRWTIIVARKLVTGSPYDIQFDRLDATYEFGIAAFDNAQVRHAVHFGAIKLKFAQ